MDGYHPGSGNIRFPAMQHAAMHRQGLPAKWAPGLCSTSRDACRKHSGSGPVSPGVIQHAPGRPGSQRKNNDRGDCGPRPPDSPLKCSGYATTKQPGNRWRDSACEHRVCRGDLELSGKSYVHNNNEKLWYKRFLTEYLTRWKKFRIFIYPSLP